MEKIKDYRVVASDKRETIVRLIKSYMEEGWIPQGGIAATKYYFYQAMIKLEIK